MSRELFIFFYSRVKHQVTSWHASLVQFYGIPTKLVRYW